MSDKTRTTRLRKFLQRKDKFGHPIGMKWLGGANTATTTLGGIMSYIIFTIQIVYLCINLDALVSRKGAKIGFDKELTEFDEIGSINLNETAFIPYIQIDKGVDWHDSHKFYNIEFENWKWDPSIEGSDEDKITKTIYSAKPCEASDFPGIDDDLRDRVL